MGAPGKWSFVFPHLVGDGDNIDQDSVASILGKIKHEGCSRQVLAAGQSPCKRRCEPGVIFGYLSKICHLKSQQASEAGKKVSVSLFPPDAFA